MNLPSTPPPIDRKLKPASPEKALNRLFLLVFVRGQSARGITKNSAPKSLIAKLGLILGLYAFMGLGALFFATQKVIVQSMFLHAITFMALGMFVATSAGEALFNKEESEILMHRPITPQMLLKAKATVLIQVSLYLALATNAAGFFVGFTASDGSLLYPFVHLISMFEEALFCTALVVLVYQLCLRWIGRERLDGIMVSMQVLVMVGIFAGSQILPRAIGAANGFHVDLNYWWLKLIPPAWFASLDDAIAGSHSRASWVLAGLGLCVTVFMTWAAFGRLASVYQTGSQTLNEGAPAKVGQRVRLSRLKRLTEVAPLRWFMRDSVSRASFLLVVAYLTRDRDVKLRIYPGIAPMMMMPVILFVTDHGIGKGGFHVMGDFMTALAASYLCIVPLGALNLLRYSQQWRAAEVFLAAPLPGPGAILQGARVAVMLFMSLPMVLLLFGFVVFFDRSVSVLLLLPGVIALPLYAMIPAVFSNAVPFSNPQEEAKNLSSFPIMMLSMFGAFLIAGVSMAFSALGLLPYFLLGETALVFGLCRLIRSRIAKLGFRVYD